MNEAQKRDFKGVWITKEIWLDDNLPWMEKLLLVEIDSLSSADKGCFASNGYFAEFFDLSKDRISKLVTSLKNKGYIEVSLVYKDGKKEIEKRIITTIGYRRKQLGGLVENTDTPIGENNEDINTSFFINSVDLNPISIPTPPPPLYIELEDMPHVKVTAVEYTKLVELIGGSEAVMTYLYNFADWILKQTKDKKNASPYLSIRKWYEEDKKREAAARTIHQPRTGSGKPKIPVALPSSNTKLSEEELEAAREKARSLDARFNKGVITNAPQNQHEPIERDVP